MRIFQTLLLFSALASIEGSDPQIEKLRSTIVSLRTHAEEYAEKHIETLGGVPELTGVKHQLRDWIEFHLGALKGNGDEKTFRGALNDILKAAGLTAKEELAENMLGYLGDMEIMRENDLLIVTTSVGILCQYDQSAYAYEWTGTDWKRIWQLEQNDYSRSKYSPQNTLTVHTWQQYKDGKKTGNRFIFLNSTSFLLPTNRSLP